MAPVADTLVISKLTVRKMRRPGKRISIPIELTVSFAKVNLPVHKCQAQVHFRRSRISLFECTASGDLDLMQWNKNLRKLFAHVKFTHGDDVSRSTLQPSNEGWGSAMIGNPHRMEMTMKRFILTAALLGGFFALERQRSRSCRLRARRLSGRLCRAAWSGGHASRLLPLSSRLLRPPLSLSPSRRGHLPVNPKRHRSFSSRIVTTSAAWERDAHWPAPESRSGVPQIGADAAR